MLPVGGTMDQVSGADRSLSPGVIDETWTKTNMAPLRGWRPHGQRIKAKVPHGRWQTMTSCRFAPRSQSHSVAHRWADQRRSLPTLRREGFGSDIAPATS